MKRVYLDVLPGDWNADFSLDVSLTIHFDNGQLVILNLVNKGYDPRFADIVSGKYKSDPMTDGTRFFWYGAPAITSDEVIDMLLSDSNGRISAIECYENRLDDIDVTLSGGHTLLLSLPPQYRAWGRPTTDGKRICWQNGSCLTIDEIITTLFGVEKKIIKLRNKQVRLKTTLASAMIGAAAVITLVLATFTNAPVPGNHTIIDDAHIPLTEMQSPDLLDEDDADDDGDDDDQDEDNADEGDES